MLKKINLEISFICCILKSFGAGFNELSTCNAFLNHIKKYVLDAKCEFMENYF
jgi:hypothetical protein